MDEKMPDMVPMEFELTATLADVAREAVESGEYPSIDAVVLAALDAWQAKRREPGWPS